MYRSGDLWVQHLTVVRFVLRPRFDLAGSSAFYFLFLFYFLFFKFFFLQGERAARSRYARTRCLTRGACAGRCARAANRFIGNVSVITERAVGESNEVHGKTISHA